MYRSGTQRQTPPSPFKRIPSRGSGIHHNYDEIIRQSAYSSRFPKHPSPACGAGVSDWTARQVDRAMGFGGERKGFLPLKGAAGIAERSPARNLMGNYLSCRCVLS
ncbi:hypothetical protein CDAR_602331 [Caerostris darwini]|uniref:Uncharacterized protein n=1 Tax=Caerostris darwini TaxID=1538125 RepID=A0AAV4ND68_9ARAC|nr:hypothetical protein CDAR_602331 [Caerostris darwini]